MIDFIINGNAGAKAPKRAKKRISAVLDQKGIPYAFHETKCAKDAIRISRELCAAGATTVVAVGGDGTINEVLNGLDVEKTNFGIIPCGSGNDFITSVNIPKNIEKALDIILNCQPKYTDFMVCDGVRGINIIGTGIDVEILKRCERSKILKGKMKYFISFLISLIKFRFYKLQLPDKDGNLKDTSALILACGNGKRFGGGINMCPNAVVDDGKMDFVFVSEVKRNKIPGAFIKLMKGKIHEKEFCHFSLEEHVFAHFDPPACIQIDGELYENLKFDITLVHDKLKLYRP